MDMPPLMFAEEIMDFYSDAKVVLNRRRDMDAWHKSLNEAAEMTVEGWGIWTLSWFDPRFRWWYESVTLCLGIMAKGKGGFKQNGTRWAEDHYRRLERKLDRRKSLSELGSDRRMGAVVQVFVETNAR